MSVVYGTHSGLYAKQWSAIENTSRKMTRSNGQRFIHAIATAKCRTTFFKQRYSRPFHQRLAVMIFLIVALVLHVSTRLPHDRQSLAFQRSMSSATFSAHPPRLTSRSFGTTSRAIVSTASFSPLHIDAAGVFCMISGCSRTAVRIDERNFAISSS